MSIGDFQVKLAFLSGEWLYCTQYKTNDERVLCNSFAWNLAWNLAWDCRNSTHGGHIELVGEHINQSFHLEGVPPALNSWSSQTTIWGIKSNNHERADSRWEQKQCIDKTSSSVRVMFSKFRRSRISRVNFPMLFQHIRDSSAQYMHMGGISCMRPYEL